MAGTFKSCNEQTSLQAKMTADHPFFVRGTYRPSWASFNPAATEFCYGINCQILQRDDVCVLPCDADVLGSLNGTQRVGDKNSFT